MKILKPIEFFYNLRLNITKMLTKGSNDVSDMKLEKLKNDYNKLEVKDSIRDFEINMRYKKYKKSYNLCFS